MAAFATMAAADARARALMETGAATVAHSCRLENGTIAVRLLRPMSATGTTRGDRHGAGMRERKQRSTCRHTSEK